MKTCGWRRWPATHAQMPMPRGSAGSANWAWQPMRAAWPARWRMVNGRWWNWVSCSPPSHGWYCWTSLQAAARRARGTVPPPEGWRVVREEPAGALTRDEVERMAEIVKNLAMRATVVVVEHDMNFVRAIAETVTVFHHGRILAQGNAETVLSDERVRAVYLGKQHGTPA